MMVCWFVRLNLIFVIWCLLWLFCLFIVGLCLFVGLWFACEFCLVGLGFGC